MILLSDDTYCFTNLILCRNEKFEWQIFFLHQSNHPYILLSNCSTYLHVINLQNLKLCSEILKWCWYLANVDTTFLSYPLTLIWSGLSLSYLLKATVWLDLFSHVSASAVPSSCCIWVVIWRAVMTELSLMSSTICSGDCSLVDHIGFLILVVSFLLVLPFDHLLDLQI